jgi:hypothetical protein
LEILTPEEVAQMSATATAHAHNELVDRVGRLEATLSELMKLLGIQVCAPAAHPRVAPPGEVLSVEEWKKRVRQIDADARRVRLEKIL